MGIYLLSISHKVAPLAVRQFFAFDLEKSKHILQKSMECQRIKEGVLLATCNRTEFYVRVCEEEKSREVYAQMQNLLLNEVDVNAESIDISKYFRMYQGKEAVTHLVRVCAGLDSMLMGEDQILGQVKEAWSLGQEVGSVGVYLNTLFRLAVTGAKKVKTQTQLSKTPVSTATLALKAVENQLGSWQGKNLMLIGGSGKIGNIVYKNALDIEGVMLYVTQRGNSKQRIDEMPTKVTVIPYEERYRYLPQMDAVISATSSPHYTITKADFEHITRQVKEQVFVDMAVPMDIEASIGLLAGTFCMDIEDLQVLAEENNQRKKLEVGAADEILETYIEEYEKWELFQLASQDLQRTKDKLLQFAKQYGMEAFIEHYFFAIRKQATFEELRIFMDLVTQTKVKKKGKTSDV